MQKERDFPEGHPSSADYDPKSPEAIEWRRVHLLPKGERDFPVDHPAAQDTKGNVVKDYSVDNQRDFSKPHTIPAAEYEGVTGRNHAEDVVAWQEREAELQAKREAARVQ